MLGKGNILLFLISFKQNTNLSFSEAFFGAIFFVGYAFLKVSNFLLINKSNFCLFDYVNFSIELLLLSSWSDWSESWILWWSRLILSTSNAFWDNSSSKPSWGNAFKR